MCRWEVVAGSSRHTVELVFVGGRKMGAAREADAKLPSISRGRRMCDHEKAPSPSLNCISETERRMRDAMVDCTVTYWEGGLAIHLELPNLNFRDHPQHVGVSMRSSLDLYL